MYVCVCNAIREEELRKAARQGTNCAKRAYAELGRKPKCGLCLPQARNLIAQEGLAISRKEYSALSA